MKKYKGIALFVLFAAISLAPASAQTENPVEPEDTSVGAPSYREIAKAMQSILLGENGEYVYGEGVNDVETKAMAEAKQTFVKNVNDQLKQIGKEELSEKVLFTEYPPEELHFFNDDDESYKYMYYYPLSKLSSLEKPANEDVDQVLAAIASSGHYTEIKKKMFEFMRNGVIQEMSMTTKSTDIPGDAFAILMDSSQNILAILSPRDKGDRRNLKTGAATDESNFPECKIILWYK